MCNYRYAGFSACHDFLSLFVCHSPSQSWTSTIGLVSLDRVSVLVLDKQVLNPKNGAKSNNPRLSYRRFSTFSPCNFFGGGGDARCVDPTCGVRKPIIAALHLCFRVPISCRTSGIHLMAIYCAAAERGALIK